VLQNRLPGPEFELLKKELGRLHYVEGTNIIFESRFAEGKLDRLPGFAAELVALNVDVIATYGGPPTAAARKATTTIPIVAQLVADPVGIGAAATLACPGGNVTGSTKHDPQRATRQLAILKEVFPKLARAAFLSDADIPGADAMLVMEVPVTILTRGRIIELATARRIPTLFWGGVSDAGVLMSYGTTALDTYARMPMIVDKILKGAKPADTPFEVVTRQEFIVNLKVARELGVTIPAEVLKRADRVIE
jgi:putative tryptophan/tyrosine transport system substrate-binding protein